MRVQLLIHDIKPEELPDVVDVLGQCDTTSPRVQRFDVTSRWIENDPHWLLMLVSAFERRFNADTHQMERLLVDTSGPEKRDITEDESAAVKRFWDTHDPYNTIPATRLVERFPLEWAEWSEDKEGGRR